MAPRATKNQEKLQLNMRAMQKPRDKKRRQKSEGQQEDQEETLTMAREEAHMCETLYSASPSIQICLPGRIDSKNSIKRWYRSTHISLTGTPMLRSIS